jgi:hypothetical protein
MLAEPREHRVVDAVRADGQLLRKRQRRLLLLVERSVLEVEDVLELRVRGPEPRSLRGV